MKYLWLALALPLLLGACSNMQPVPERPVSLTAIPQATKAVIGNWKMGDYVQGYRIETDKYVFITDGQGLYGQEGSSFGGPGLVPYATVKSFEPIFKDADAAQSGKIEMTFYCDLVVNDNGSPLLFNGKKVVYLYNATYKGQKLEVNRSPWDN